VKRQALITTFVALALTFATQWVMAQQRNCTVAGLGLGWTLQHVSPQGAQFSAHFTVTPSRDDAETLVGLSNGNQSVPAQFATLLRFNAQGQIDARNGSVFTSFKPRRYHAGERYKVRMDVDLATHSWSVWVKETGGQKARPFVLIGQQMAFSPETATLTQIDTLGMQMNAVGAANYARADSAKVCRVVVQTVTPQPPNADCTLIVPESPLTAQGLATPYLLQATDPAKGACHQVNAEQSAFVQAAVFNPGTGQVSVYSPLVIDKGSVPAADPVVPVLPPNAIVAIWFGYNGDNLTLKGRRTALADGLCINGLEGSVFGQFANCNAPAFFDAANAAIGKGQLVVPPLGMGVDGQDCPTTRSYRVADQDPSDNVQTNYLNVNGQIAQATAANRARFPNAVSFGNPSDEGLVSKLVGPALGCASWSVPNLADPGARVPALALNELTAAKYQKSPVALVPANDPMVLVDGAYSLDKLNAYRKGVNQPLAQAADKGSAAKNCTNLRNIAPAGLDFDRSWLTKAASPFPDVADSLFTFLAQRYVASYALLDCEALISQPVNAQLTQDANGVTVGASFTR
jgi:hypothetical protein